MSFDIKDQFIIRTPILSLKEFTNIFHEVKDDYNENNILFDSGNIIFDYLNWTNYWEAIIISSPSLYKSFQNYNNLKLKNKKQVIKSVINYFIRMTSRATPYGVLSG